MEGVGSENSSISRCNFNESLVENLPPQKTNRKWNFSGFCLLYEFCYTHRHNSNSFRNYRCFLSNTTTNMQILATMTEEQPFEYGHLCAPFIQATQYCPCSHKKLVLMPGTQWGPPSSLPYGLGPSSVQDSAAHPVPPALVP